MGVGRAGHMPGGYRLREQQGLRTPRTVKMARLFPRDPVSRLHGLGAEVPKDH